MHSTPEAAKPRRKGVEAPEPKQRAESYPEGHIMLSLPNADEYLIEVFHFIGMCSNSGMGLSYISWQELESFRRNSNYYLTNWDCEVLIMMSKLYVNWINKGKKRECFSPWDDVEAYNSAKAP